MTSKNDYELRELILELERRKASRSLYHFSKLAWNVIEPNVPFVDGWHLEAICKHLEATCTGEIKNLVINMPPRHMKSSLVSVIFPAWVWINRPHIKWLFASYAQNLSTRDSVKCRLLLESNWYKSFFNIKWHLSGDQNQKIRFSNSEQGYRIATSVGGTGTGDGGNFIVCDDALKATDAHSEVSRNNVIRWWDEEMSSRGNDEKTTVKIIVMQRLHVEDLSGHVLKSNKWEHLILPAEYEGKKNTTSIGWEDPRNDVGDLLWPNRFSKEYISDLKYQLGSLGAAGQLQQRPYSSEGNLFKRSWWKFYNSPPQFKRVVQFMDCAQKVGITNDYSVCTTWGEAETGYYLLDMWKAKVEAPDLERAAISNYNKWKPQALVIEDKSSGSSLIQSLRRKTNIPVISYDPKQRDKIVRASAATPLIESGRCFLPESESWLEDFILEHEIFPNGKNDDIVDTTSMCAEYFQSRQVPKYRIRRL
jgi:predicted phage terminase large subunit-like protein